MANLRTAVLIAVTAAAAFPQSSERVSFEVASVKPLAGFPSGFSLSPRRSGDRITWNTNRALLLMYAWRLQDWQISGLPPSDLFYAINAKTAEGATEDQVRQMFQALLADRFGLVVHRETQQRNGYALIVANNGAKIKAVAPEDKTAPLPDWFKGKGPEFVAAIEGRLEQTMEGRGQTAVTGRRVPIARLAESLQKATGAFVIDQTGLTGDYYFALLFANDRGGNTEAATDAPSLFTALQEQLGLKLEKRKGPVEMLIVDHIEKVPTD